jgi:hypothetical protein
MREAKTADGKGAAFWQLSPHLRCERAETDPLPFSSLVLSTNRTGKRPTARRGLPGCGPLSRSAPSAISRLLVRNSGRERDFAACVCRKQIAFPKNQPQSPTPHLHPVECIATVLFDRKTVTTEQFRSLRKPSVVTTKRFRSLRKPSVVTTKRFRSLRKLSVVTTKRFRSLRKPSVFTTKRFRSLRKSSVVTTKRWRSLRGFPRAGVRGVNKSGNARSAKKVARDSARVHVSLAKRHSLEIVASRGARDRERSRELLCALRRSTFHHTLTRGAGVSAWWGKGRNGSAELPSNSNWRAEHATVDFPSLLWHTAGSVEPLSPCPILLFSLSVMFFRLRVFAGLVPAGAAGARRG